MLNVETFNEETNTIVYMREDHEAYEEINEVIKGYKISKDYCDSDYKIIKYVQTPYPTTQLL